MSHWHVSHTDSDNVDTAGDIFEALEVGRYQLDQDVDYMYQGISSYGESGHFEQAYRAWQTTERLANVRDNLDNIVDQHNGTKKRAPLYSGPDGDALLTQAATRLVARIYSETSLSLWECSDPECDGQTYEED